MKVRVPVEYVSKIDWTGNPKQTFTITDDGETIKSQVYIFSDNEDEVYIKKINQFNGMVRNYNLHTDAKGGTQGVNKKLIKVPTEYALSINGTKKSN